VSSRLKWALILSLATVSQTALAADLASRKAPLVPPPPSWTWTGFYVGANAGSNILVNGTPYVMGGIQGGYNYQFTNNVVLGFEADVDVRPTYNDRRTFTTNASGTPFNNRIIGNSTLVNTARARAGYAFGRYLPYVTGGLVYGDYRLDETNAILTGPFAGYTWHGDHTWLRTGWTVGGGLEYAFTDHITFKGEYLYYRFERVQLTTYLNVIPGRSELGAYDTGQGHIARLGVNYKF